MAAKRFIVQTIAFLQKFVNYGLKEFYNIGPRIRNEDSNVINLLCAPEEN
jgi:hypothetical protein